MSLANSRGWRKKGKILIFLGEDKNFWRYPFNLEVSIHINWPLLLVKAIKVRKKIDLLITCIPFVVSTVVSSKFGVNGTQFEKKVSRKWRQFSLEQLFSG